MQELGHPNVVRYLDVFLARGDSTGQGAEMSLSLVMELMSGGSLRKAQVRHRKARAPIPETIVWRWTLLLFRRHATLLRRIVNCKLQATEKGKNLLAQANRKIF